MLPITMERLTLVATAFTAGATLAVTIETEVGGALATFAGTVVNWVPEGGGDEDGDKLDNEDSADDEVVVN